jgi:hypothetical protein
MVLVLGVSTQYTVRAVWNSCMRQQTCMHGWKKQMTVSYGSMKVYRIDLLG